MVSSSDGRKIVMGVGSRQQVLGVKATKEKNKKRAKTLCELERENYELKRAQDKHDDELAELDMELKEAKLELGKALAKVDKLENQREVPEVIDKRINEEEVGEKVEDERTRMNRLGKEGKEKQKG